MTANEALYSIAKTGRNYSWMAADREAFYNYDVNEVVEGKAETKEEAAAAARKAMAERGIENASETFAFYVKSYKRHRREAGKPNETAEFQGRDYLWEEISFFSDQTNEQVVYWEKVRVTRVTGNYVFIRDRNERNRRLDRGPLDRDGVVYSRRGLHCLYSFYTEAGYKASVEGEKS